MMKRLIENVKKFETILKKFPEVKYAGDPTLRTVAQKVSFEEGMRIGKLLGDVLMRYRKEVGYGRGFAAPQIGENKAVFVTYIDDQLQVFINPTIIEVAEKTNFYRELCLSSGLMAVDVERPTWIVMEWIDGQNRAHKEKFDGFLARLYQHEEAHLRGILNLDQASKGGIEFALFDPLVEQIRE